ncbi:ANTAR domain-containing protein [Streptomyces sp. NPDC050534]|uniref:ANTAR domain-containing protein n=1 Tax=Streptomyces sp. NPDC050534 TaxID=3365625 RepID=UPI0037891C79
MFPLTAASPGEGPCSDCGAALRQPTAPAAVPAPVTFSVGTVGDRLVVVVCGELDLESNLILQQTLGEALARTTGGLELDLSGVGFCDCSALNVLLHMHHRAHTTAKSFIVRATSPAVHRLLTLTGTLPLFTQGRTEPGGQPATPPPPAAHHATGQGARAGLPAAREVCEPSPTGHTGPAGHHLAVENAQLRRALHTRAPVDLARGMLMASFHLNAEQARQVLVTASQHSNTKLREIADTLLQSADSHTPVPEPLAGHLAGAVRLHTDPAS